MKLPSEESIIKKYSYMKLPHFECDDGWNKLISDLCRDLAKVDKKKEIRVLQIKEKYGSLRFYTSYFNQKCHEIINDYEFKSCQICEICGETGQECVNEVNYYKTLCDKHQEEFKYIPCSRKKI